MNRVFAALGIMITFYSCAQNTSLSLPKVPELISITEKILSKDTTADIRPYLAVSMQSIATDRRFAAAYRYRDLEVIHLAGDFAVVSAVRTDSHRRVAQRLPLFPKNNAVAAGRPARV